MTAALEGGEWSAARPGRTLPPERLSTRRTGGWLGPMAGLEAILKQSIISLHPLTVRIANGLLCVSSLEIIKHQRITFTSIYRLLSAPYDVAPHQSNKTFYKPSVTQIYLAAICRVCCRQQRFDMKVTS